MAYRKLTAEEIHSIVNSREYESLDSFDDIAIQMVIDACGELSKLGYEDYELESVGDGKNNIEVAQVNGKMLIYYVNDVIYEAPESMQLFTFIRNGIEAIKKWYISFMGPIYDGDELFFNDDSFEIYSPKNESVNYKNKKVVRIKESELKKMIYESVKSIIKTL